MAKIFKDLLESNVIQSPKMLTKYVEGLGWKHQRSTKHHIYTHSRAKHHLSIPIGKGDLGRNLAHKLMKQASDLQEDNKPKESKDPDDAASRFDGSDSVVKIYKQDTPGEEGKSKHKKKIKKKIQEAFVLFDRKRKTELTKREKLKISQSRSLSSRNKDKSNIDIPPEKRADSLKKKHTEISDKDFQSALSMKSQGKKFADICSELPHIKPSHLQLRLVKHKKDNP